MLTWFRNRTVKDAKALQLYGSSVAQARQPAFYRRDCVADTLDGRFELVMMHVALLLRRLTAEGEAGKQLGRAVVEQMFAALDDDMREIGIGDLNVPKKVHAAASAFYGRLNVYDEALKAGDLDALTGAAKRNFPAASGTEVASERIASYMMDTAGALAAQPLEDLLRGHVRYLEREGTPV